MPVCPPPRYLKRSVDEWLRLADDGRLVLPVFQRSYVWKRHQTIADYLLALFENRPTGIFLVLLTNGRPQFHSRPLRRIDGPVGIPDELLLDGQQRLTSLWEAFNGRAQVRYYVKIDAFVEKTISPCDVLFWSNRSPQGRAMRDPKRAHAERIVPIDILQDRVTPECEHGQIWDWCFKAAIEDGNAAKGLERTIKSLGTQLMLKRDLHYCEIDATVSKNTAIDIFIQSNKSSARVNEFDIAVAIAVDQGGEDLRQRILDFHHASSVTPHYIKEGPDEESSIAPLGQWLLFAACIQVQQVAPKKQRFETVIRKLFERGSNEANKIIDKLLVGIEAALGELADHGAPTATTLPSLPTLHVIASLQDELNAVRGAAAIGTCKSLISAYIWRSFFTERYESRANDRLFEDYRALVACIRKIDDTGTYSVSQLPRIFDEDVYRLPTSDMLGNIGEPIPWIRSGTRIGRAVASIVLHDDPTDWLTNDKLNTRKVRELEGNAKLHRHHVFPKDILRGKIPNKAINHGLNGVILSKPANLALSKTDPAEFMPQFVQERTTPSLATHRRRVESHLVPYDIITAQRDVTERYREFLAERAQRIADRVAELTKLPGT